MNAKLLKKNYIICWRIFYDISSTRTSAQLIKIVTIWSYGFPNRIPPIHIVHVSLQTLVPGQDNKHLLPGNSLNIAAYGEPPVDRLRG